MSIWVKNISLEKLNALNDGTLMSSLGIQFSAVGDDYIEGTIPVDKRTVQPMGVLHGGASAALAETLASLGAYLSAPEGAVVAGVELNINHLKACRGGMVTGRAQPLRLGRSIQVWEVRLYNEAGDMSAVARMTASIKLQAS